MCLSWPHWWSGVRGRGLTAGFAQPRGGGALSVSVGEGLHPFSCIERLGYGPSRRVDGGVGDRSVVSGMKSWGWSSGSFCYRTPSNRIEGFQCWMRVMVTKCLSESPWCPGLFVGIERRGGQSQMVSQVQDPEHSQSLPGSVRPWGPQGFCRHKLPSEWMRAHVAQPGSPATGHSAPVPWHRTEPWFCQKSIHTQVTVASVAGWHEQISLKASGGEEACGQPPGCLGVGTSPCMPLCWATGRWVGREWEPLALYLPPFCVRRAGRGPSLCLLSQPWKTNT